MNVLHLIDTLDLGGAQVIVKNFIESDLPHNQYVFALRSTKICIPINGKVTVFPGEARYSFKPIKSICDFIKNNNIEILHCHLFRSQFFGYIIKRYFFPDIKLIFHEHGPLSERFEGFITKMFLRYSRNILDKSIAVSEMMKRLLIDSGKIECTKISILPNFIFPEYFKENKDKNREEFRKKHNLSDDTFVVGYAARMIPRKGWKTFLKSLNNINVKNITVIFAGTGKDKEELKKMLKETDFPGDLKYIGYVSEMEKFYAGIDCFIIPSWWEPFGLTALEAQAAGVPVIASDIPGLTEVVNWGNALLFPVKNSTLLACQISALEHSKMLRERLVRKGYANIKRFEKTAILEQLNQLYQSF
ncbi:MAG: glycosyltransferase family 4 protein [Spirochaetales bacterium]|nr:glycosyltransferase family 4 protein [Spirochaetales bacterium]